MALKADTHAAVKDTRVAAHPPDAPGWTRALEVGMRGFVVTPQMPDYEAARAGNPLYPASPTAVAFCAVERDVALCLKTAEENGLSIACRSGRHSTAGYSLCDGLVIDVSLMDAVTVDYAARTARVGAGANFGRLNAVLDTYMLHVPGGTCADVGVAGFMQGGGYGFTSRELGMNCDRVAAVRVMLADGQIVVGSPATNPDLHWAIRGGTGGQFGVLLDVTYRLAELYDVWGFAVKWDLADAPAVLATLEEGFMGDAHDELGYLAVLTTLSGSPALLVFGMYHGDPAIGRSVLGPVLTIGTPTFVADTVDTYATLNDALLAALPGPPSGATTYEAKRSGLIAKPLGESGWAEVVKYFSTTPNPFNIAVIEPYGAAIARVPTLDSAFVHRNSRFDFFVDSFWQHGWHYNDEQAAWDWVNGYLDIVAPYRNGEVYQNYPERSLADYRQAYWGKAFPRLLGVKRAADPGNVFAFAQSISPAPGVEPQTVPALVPEPYS